MAIRTGYDRRAGFGGSGTKRRSSVRPGTTSNRSAGRGAVVLANRSHASLNVGRGRGILGGGTGDLLGRRAFPHNASGNYGGGYAGVYAKGTRPDGARRRG